MRNSWITLVVTLLAGITAINGIGGIARADAQPAILRPFRSPVRAIHISVTPEERGATPTHVDAVRAIANTALAADALDFGSTAVTLDLSVVEARPVFAQRHVEIGVRLRLVVTDTHDRMLAVVTACATAHGNNRAVLSNLRTQAIAEAMTGLADQLKARRRPAIAQR